ncbi:MAG: lipopolysaccharide heptosyltransferase family protein [Cytophagales bacterium]|nr:MAG: lipopolysaccharide heptosyltransferase family protein [Cytophagales bacterium]TAF60179.1 MAG: lipopolysaccharide heptosyltransferase family protein [Cytophagales bacterium]
MVWQRILSALRLRLCLLVDFLVIRLVKRSLLTPPKALLVRLDAIGDYVLFRNTLTELEGRGAYLNHEFYLCGNEVWQELHEFLDKSFLKGTFFINRRHFLENPFYRYRWQAAIRRMGFDVVIEPTHSRLWLLGDAICRVTGAPERVADFGNTDNVMPKDKTTADSYFTHLVASSSQILFEFERNKRFAEKALKIYTSQTWPFLKAEQTQKVQELQQKKVSEIGLSQQPYLALFAGASEAYKRWPVEYFAACAQLLTQKTKLQTVVLLGAPDDATRNAQLAKLLDSSIHTIDMSGKTTLSELLGIISGAALLVTNETSAVHLAVLAQTKCVCLANGRHLGRFSPYVPQPPFLAYFFPPQIQEAIGLYGLSDALKAQYCQSMGLDIKDIAAEEVSAAAMRLLGVDSA